MLKIFPVLLAIACLSINLDRASATQSNGNPEFNATSPTQSATPQACSQLLSISSVSAAETRPLHSLAQASFLLAQRPLVDLKTDLEFPGSSELSPYLLFEMTEAALAQVIDYLFAIFQMETAHVPELNIGLNSLSQLVDSILIDMDGVHNFGSANAIHVVKESAQSLANSLNYLTHLEVEFFQRSLPIEQTPQRLYNLASYIDQSLDRVLTLEEFPTYLAYHPLYLSLFFDLREAVDRLTPAESARLSSEWLTSLKYSFENSQDLLRAYERQADNLAVLEMINGPIRPSYSMEIKMDMETSLRQASDELRRLATSFSLAPEQLFSAGH